MLRRGLGIAIVIGMLVALGLTTENKPRVFITDSQSWEIMGNAGGTGGTFAAHTQGGARPQTAEIIKTFGERCPQVVVNNKRERADYIVLLDHEGGKGIARRRNKIAVFNKDGDAVVSRSTRSLGNSVQDACEAITKDWTAHETASSGPSVSISHPASDVKKQSEGAVSPTATPAPIPEAKQLVTPSQATPPPSTTQSTSTPQTTTGEGMVSVTSDPDGAEIFVDSIGHGQAPQILKLAPGEHAIQLVTSGYKDWSSKVMVKANSIVNVTGTLQKLNK